MEQDEQQPELLQAIIEGMKDKKAYDICLLNLKKINTAVADYFLLCNGLSALQVEAIAASVMEKSQRLTHQHPWKKEGFSNKEWIILDYINVIVHIFQQEKRIYYSLETLWGDAGIKCF
jgi:ribosome-associated protein